MVLFPLTSVAILYTWLGSGMKIRRLEFLPLTMCENYSYSFIFLS